MTDEGTIDLGFRPRIWQQLILPRLRRFNVLVVHARAGKTELACILLVDAALRTRWPDAEYAYVAPFLNQAKRVAWRKLKRYAKRVPGVEVNEADHCITFPNGSRIWVLGADNPDSLRGMGLDGLVVDEMAQMRGNVWGEVLRPRVMDRKGWAVFIGTVKGINAFWQLYLDALHWMQDVSDPWFAQLLTVDDTKVFDEAELNQAKRDMTEQQVRQEFYCDPTAAVDGQLIPFDLVLAASRRELLPEQYDFAPKIISVDVADAGGRSVITPSQGLMVWDQEVHRVNNMVLAGKIASLWDRWHAHACFIDAGAGSGVISRLQELKYKPIAVNFGGAPIKPEYLRKDAEMWDAALDFLEGGGVLPDDPELHAELCVRTYNYDNPANRKALEKKKKAAERLRRGLDKADSFVLKFAYPVANPSDHKRGAVVQLPTKRDRFRRRGA